MFASAELLLLLLDGPSPLVFVVCSAATVTGSGIGMGAGRGGALDRFPCLDSRLDDPGLISSISSSWC